MSDKHDIITYSKLGEAAGFYLNESFHYINSAIKNELAGIIFSEKINKIDPSAEDRLIVEKTRIPNDTIALLQNKIDDVMTNETTNKFILAWQQAQADSQTTKHSFQKSHLITDIELLGHFNCLAFFIETLANRHLLFLKQTSQLNNFVYNQLSLAKILNRLIFVCKREVEENLIQLNEIANLFSYRNKTVHYTPDNAISIQVDIAKLIRIWNQTGKLIIVFETREKFDEEKFSKLLTDQIVYFENKWLNKNNCG